MEVADIEEEEGNFGVVVRFTSFNAVTADEWEKLEANNNLNLGINKKTQEEELPAFLTELLARREKASLRAVHIHFGGEYNDSERNKKLLRCFKGTLSSKSRVYL